VRTAIIIVKEVAARSVLVVANLVNECTRDAGEESEAYTISSSKIQESKAKEIRKEKQWFTGGLI